MPNLSFFSNAIRIILAYMFMSGLFPSVTKFFERICFAAIIQLSIQNRCNSPTARTPESFVFLPSATYAGNLECVFQCNIQILKPIPFLEAKVFVFRIFRTPSVNCKFYYLWLADKISNKGVWNIVNSKLYS